MQNQTFADKNPRTSPDYVIPVLLFAALLSCKQTDKMFSQAQSAFQTTKVICGVAATLRSELTSSDVCSSIFNDRSKQCLASSSLSNSIKQQPRSYNIRNTTIRTKIK